jgi:hypothetical protein
MVGADREQTRGKVWLDRGPWSAASFFDDVLALALDRVAQGAAVDWSYGVREHLGGSDHVAFHAPEIGVPAAMLGHFPDLYYHTNLDTPDKTDAAEFERVGVAVVDALETFDRPARSVGDLVLRSGVERIRLYARRRLDAEDRGDYVSDVGALLAKEQATLASLGAAGDGLEHVAAAEVETLRARGRPVTRPRSAHAGRVLRKLLPGPLSTHLHGLTVFHDRLGARALEYRERSLENLRFVLWTTEVYNLADGRRGWDEIVAMVSAELEDGAPSPEELDAFAADLVETELADWVH